MSRRKLRTCHARSKTGTGSSGKSAPSAGRRTGGSGSIPSRGRTSASMRRVEPRGGMGRMSCETGRRGPSRPRSAPSHQPASSKTNAPLPTLKSEESDLTIGTLGKALDTFTAGLSSSSPPCVLPPDRWIIGRPAPTCPKCNPSTRIQWARRIRSLRLYVLEQKRLFWLRVYSTLWHFIGLDTQLQRSAVHTLRQWAWRHYRDSTLQASRYALTLVQEGTLSVYTAPSGRCSTAPSESCCACHKRTEG